MFLEDQSQPLRSPLSVDRVTDTPSAETPPVPALSLINKEAARATEVQTDQLKAHRKGYGPMTVALQSDRMQVTPLLTATQSKTNRTG